MQWSGTRAVWVTSTVGRVRRIIHLFPVVTDSTASESVLITALPAIAFDSPSLVWWDVLRAFEAAICGRSYPAFDRALWAYASKMLVLVPM
jgi:hypothetical protein